MKFKLIHKIFLSMLIVFLIPTISITTQSLHCSTEAVYDLQKDALYSQAVRVNKEINSWLLERVNDMQLWQEHRNLLTYLAPEHLNHDHWKQDSSYEALFLLNERGEIDKSFGIAHNEFLNLSNKKMNLINEEGYAILGSIHNHNDNHYSIHLGVAVYDINNKLTYNVVVLNLSKAFQNIFPIHTNDYPYEISIINADKVDILKRLNELKEQEINWFFDNEDQIGEYTLINGVEKIALSQKSLIDQWVILISADKQKTFSWIQILKERIGYTALLAVIVVLVLGAFLSWGVSRPFQAIIEYSRNVSQGKSNRLKKVKKGDEALIVITAIDAMIDTINNKNIEIQNKTTLATVGELTSSVVHEFRNPLSSIKMNLQALKPFLKNEETYSELTQIAFDQTLKLEKMLKELLVYGKPIQLELEDVNLELLMETLKNQCGIYTQNQSIEIHFFNKADIENIIVDKHKIISVIVNLIENATHAMQGRGKIAVEFDIEKETKNFQIKIADSGPGIPGNLLSELFLPFVTSKDEGTGLGLAIVMKFVKLHGGTITVKNNEPIGALFEILIPNRNIG